MNKIEKLAVAMSVFLFDSRSVSINNTTVYDDNQQPIPVDFIKDVLNNETHVESIKEKIRLSVLEDVTNNPDQHEMYGDTLYYNADLYVYGYLVDEYIKDNYAFDNPVMENVHVCDFCDSDNVQTKAWVNPNKNNKFVDLISDEMNDNYCDDCEQNTTLTVVQKNSRHDVIGFQVIGEDGSKEEGEIHPNMEASFCVYSLDQAKAMINDTNNGEEQWRLLSVWTNDIEEPTMMFEDHDPRELKSRD